MGDHDETYRRAVTRFVQDGTTPSLRRGAKMPHAVVHTHAQGIDVDGGKGRQLLSQDYLWSRTYPLPGEFFRWDGQRWAPWERPLATHQPIRDPWAYRDWAPHAPGSPRSDEDPKEALSLGLWCVLLLVALLALFLWGCGPGPTAPDPPPPPPVCVPKPSVCTETWVLQNGRYVLQLTCTQAVTCPEEA